jgi:eukaryotic-like serine/threonine-protein kinase
MSHHTGELVGGRYRLNDRIASGGMGEVWQATDTVLGRDVAVKTLHSGLVADPQMARRFRHEALAMAALHHPGIADVYDFGQDPDADAYLVMAYVGGQPLNQRIAEQGRLNPAETMSIVAQAARALQTAHDAGIVHRDVKPGNILIQPDGTAVLVDFGIASSFRSAARTGADEVVGTAHYIAPEQVAKRPVGPAADEYALGAVAYHCLAGHPPFLGDNPITVAMQHVKTEPPPLPPDVPPAVRAVVTTALAKDPAARFRSAAAMAAAAEQATGADADTLPLRAGHVPPGRVTPSSRTRRRHLLTGLTMALLVLLGAGTALALADRLDRLPEPRPPATSAPTPSAVPSTAGSTRPADGTGAGESPSLTPTPSPTTTSRSPSPSPSTSTTPPPATTPTTTPPIETPTSKPPTSPAPSGTAATTVSLASWPGSTRTSRW